jgi:pyridine nucleotide-disulfide oxidoreductase family protein
MVTGCGAQRMKRLILAGGGHAHLHVLKRLAAQPLAGTEVLLVTPARRQIYSGMVPGWMAGHYSLDQCAAALDPLVAAAGVRLVEDAVVGLDADGQTLHTAASGSLPYDVLSLDTGAGLDTTALADTSAALLPIRPLERFVAAWPQQLDGFRQRGSARLAVVGGGAAGVELALAAAWRLRRELPPAAVEVSLVAGGGLLAGHGPRVVAHARAALAAQGIRLVNGRAHGANGGLLIDDETRIAVDAIIAATGSRPVPWLAGTGLALAADGFVAVGDGQQSASHAAVFAGGDVASRVDAPHARSGVYAVRAGPVLAANLPRALAGEAPLSYQPQRRSLYLLATGPKSAIVSWGGFAASGGWAWHWKDWIDRRFMRQYAATRLR